MLLLCLAWVRRVCAALLLLPLLLPLLVPVLLPVQLCSPLVRAQPGGSERLDGGLSGFVAVAVEAAGSAAPFQSFAALSPPAALAPLSPSPLSLSVVGGVVHAASPRGFCRGFDLPGSLRLCVQPGDAIDLQLHLTATQPQHHAGAAQLASNAAWTAAMRQMAVEVKVVQGEDQGVPVPSSIMTLRPSELLPLDVDSPSSLASRSSAASPWPSSLASFPFPALTVGGVLQVVASQLGVFSLAFDVAQPSAEAATAGGGGGGRGGGEEGAAAAPQPLLVELRRPPTLEIEVRHHTAPDEADSARAPTA